MQMDVEIGGGAEALDDGDGAVVGFAAFECRLFEQKLGNDALNDLQYRGEQLRMVGEQYAQRNRKRQHPLAHWHPWDDIIHQVGALCTVRRATQKADGPLSPSLVCSKRAAPYWMSWPHRPWH